MTGEFADAPVSVAEVRSDRSGSAADWMPRDVLVNLLRRIDRGEANPETLIVCWIEPDKEQRGEFTSGYLASGKDPLRTVGLLARIIHRYQTMNED